MNGTLFHMGGLLVNVTAKIGRAGIKIDTEKSVSKEIRILTFRKVKIKVALAVMWSFKSIECIFLAF